MSINDQNEITAWEPGVSVIQVNNFLEYWKEAGCDMDVIYSLLQEHRDHLGDIHYRVPLSIVTELFELLAGQLKDPVMGLRIGMRLTPARLGVVGSVIMSATSTQTALKALMRYTCLVTDAGSFSVQINDKTARLVLEQAPGISLSDHQVDGIFATIIRQGRMILGFDLKKHEAESLLIRFTHGDHGCGEIYERMLQGKVLFNQQENAIEVNASLYLYPRTFGLANPAFHEQQLEEAEKIRSIIKQNVSISKRVRQLLEIYTDPEHFNINRIAGDLCMSTRALQQKLQEEKQSFRGIVDRFRQERAEKMLKENQLPIHDIAFLLGYSEVSAFYRSFKRWTGAAPRLFAEQQGRKPEKGKAES